MEHGHTDGKKKGNLREISPKPSFKPPAANRCVKQACLLERQSQKVTHFVRCRPPNWLVGKGFPFPSDSSTSVSNEAYCSLKIRLVDPRNEHFGSYCRLDKIHFKTWEFWQLKSTINIGLDEEYTYLDKIGMWFPRTHRILNHCLRRLRGCRHVRMTWGTICITPITTGSWVRWIAASIPICWVVIPGPLARVIAIRWVSMCCVCWNESMEGGVKFHISQRLITGCFVNCDLLFQPIVAPHKMPGED